MADRIGEILTDRIPTDDIGATLENFKVSIHAKRFSFERRWYENNLFDDGYHFATVLRQQNKIFDLQQNRSIYAPLRALPKASKQIRGITNLLVSQNYTPIVYPQNIDKEQFPDTQDPQTGQTLPNPEYQAAVDEAKRQAKMQGRWLEKEFLEQDIVEKLAFMCLLTMKHGVSFLKIFPDAIREKICTVVRDAFDIYLYGENTELNDSPVVIESTPQFIGDIKANKWFDEKQKAKLNPDNRYASSEIKQAYMNLRYSLNTRSEYLATIMQNEAYLKEYISKENLPRIRKQKNANEILQGKQEGDPIIRQVFSVGNIWLRDQYLALSEYPYVEFRMEPGPLYQVPQIERFMPSNKSLDLISSRIERYTHTMVSGAWIQPKSEGNLDISNKAGGQIIKYTAVPPVQAQIAPIPGFVFNFISFLNEVIEEQGVSTSVLGRIPSGVKASSAIENLKESEYAGLIMAQQRLKKTVKDIAKKLLYYADDYFITPKTVYYLNKGEPEYFDVIGQYGFDKREELKQQGYDVSLPKNAVKLSKKCYVDIDIEQGMAYTHEGKKAAMKDLMQDILAFAQAGYIPPEAIKAAVQSYLDTYKFGATQDFMEAMNNYQGVGNLTDQQIQAIKVAVVEVMKDLQGSEILPDQKTRIDEAKVASLEALKDSGLIDNKPVDPKTQVEIAQKHQEMMQSSEEHKVKLAQMAQNMAITQEKAKTEIDLKKQQTNQSMKLQAKQASQQKKVGGDS